MTDIIQKPETGATADRRSFMLGAGATAAGLSALAFGGSPISAATARRRVKAAGGGDLGLLQGALALEHEGIAAYTIAAGSGLLTPGTLKVASVFLGHHNAHRDSLAQLIQKAGGKPVDAKSDGEYVAELNLGALKSEGDVVKLAAMLEQGAANAYLAQVTELKDRATQRLFVQLSTDEAVHWALLNAALGNALSPNAYLFG